MTSIKAPSPAPLGLAFVSCFGQESRCSSCSSGCDAEGNFHVKKGNLIVCSANLESLCVSSEEMVVTMVVVGVESQKIPALRAI